MAHLFSSSTGLYRKGADVATTHTLLLYFNFPLVAKARYQDSIGELSRVAGWQVQLNDNPNQEALRRVALEVLPKGAKVRKGLSVRVQERAVELKFAVSYETKARVFAMPEYKEALDRFAAETGMRLILGLGNGYVLSYSEEGVAGPSTTAKTSDLTQRSACDGLFLPENQDSPCEINVAYSCIRERFAALGVENTKTGKKYHGPTGRDYVGVTFLSPLTCEGYGAELQDQANGLGWPLAISPNPNQHV